jgi:hypothetical protein
MWPKNSCLFNLFSLYIANVAYFQRKIKLSEFSAYPDGSRSQITRVTGVILYVSLMCPTRPVYFIILDLNSVRLYSFKIQIQSSSYIF